ANITLIEFYKNSDSQRKSNNYKFMEQIAIETSASNSMVDTMTEYINPYCFKEHIYKHNQKSNIYSFGVIFENLK
ncbi:27450_t:CDS:1, partial [Dentiscutata erythropus]